MQEDGNILGQDGTPLGKITEGDPADLVGMALNDQGEILDEDGDVIGRAETLPQEVKQEAEDAAGDLPGLDALEGLEVQEGGEIKDADGNVSFSHIRPLCPFPLLFLYVMRFDRRRVGKEGEESRQKRWRLKCSVALELPCHRRLCQVVERDKGVDTQPTTVGVDKEVSAWLCSASTRVAFQWYQSPLISWWPCAWLRLPNAPVASPHLQPLLLLQFKFANLHRCSAKITEGDPADLIGRQLNAEGEVLDDDGDVIGRAEVVPEAADAARRCY